MCGRIASRSKAPTSPRAAPLTIDTVKWLAQNSASRSVNGRCVVAAVLRRAALVGLHQLAKVLGEALLERLGIGHRALIATAVVLRSRSQRR